MHTELPLAILHSDPDFVIVNKSRGMLSVPGRGEGKKDCVAERVKEMFPGAPAYPAVHRLDMDTSGLMVVALSVRTLRELNRQFQNRIVRKSYIALLEGVLEQESGCIELPFRLDVENRPLQIYDTCHGKMGITEWERVKIEGARTRVIFKPITGRTHQLRVHAAHGKGLGIPIVGDVLYGSAKESGGLMLHASSLSFRHPVTGERFTFSSDPDF